MSYRVLTVALTLVTACGVGASAIAREPLRPSPKVLLSQNNEALTAPRPSEGVQQLQARLAELGYYDGSVDGIFNAETRDALAAFQRDSGLVGTGILDPITRQRLVNPEASSSPVEGEPADLATEPPASAPNASATDAPIEDFPSPDQSAASNGLPSVPGEDAPEDIIESDLEGNLTGEEQEGIPDLGSENDPDAIAAPGEDSLNLDVNEDGDSPTAEPEAIPEEALADRGPSLVLLLGLAIMALGGIGTGLLLWSAKRRSGQNTAASTTDLTESGGAIADSASMHSPPSVPSAPTATSSTTHNGHLPTALAAESATHSSESASWSLAVGSEPKMAKINIIHELIQDLASPDPTMRHKAIWELGQRGNSAAVQPLASLLIEADSHEQGLILAALSEISIKTLKPMNRAVAIALQDDNPEVRKNAIRDVSRIYDSLGQVGRMLGHATTDSDPEVRQTANWALEQLNHMRLSANESAAFLQESRNPTESLPEDGSAPR